MPDGRVLIAFDDGPLEPNPLWTRIDNVDNLVARFEVNTGRQSELDETETGSAVVYLNDTDGLFDPDNVSSPYFAQLDGRQIMLQVFNPVDSTWYTRFRGLIDDYGFDLHPSTDGSGVSVLSNVQIECVGFMEYLAGADLLPGVHGDPVPAAVSDGVVFYEDGPVNTRIEQVLNQFGIDPDMYVVFTGNVNVQEGLYDPGDKALSVVRDAADAEFPGLGNFYEDRLGRLVFHGRGAKIDPDGVSAGAGAAKWDFRRWKVGDGAAITLDPEYAQIRPPVTFNRSRSRIINAALVTPAGVAETAISGLVYQDATSITDYGVHSVSWTEILNDGHKTNGNTATDECLLMATFYVENYKDPRTRPERVTVKAIKPTDDRAEPTWDVLCKSDIADVIRLTVGYPNGVGYDEDCFIEGWSQTVTPLNADHDYVEITFNLSPTSYYTDNVFDD